MDFTGILICSDFDGTLYWDHVPSANVEAIKYFQENGGLFTFCSGRNAELFEGMNLGFHANAPIVGYSGAEVFDPISGKIVRELFMEPDYGEICMNALNLFPRVHTINLVFKNYESRFSAKPDNLKRELDKAHETGEQLYKASFFYNNFPDDEMIPKVIADYTAGKCSAIANCADVFGLCSGRATKGTGARFVKEYTHSETLICVGDFQGDIDMLKKADIGYAVGNARPEVKANADRITVHARDGAIAAIIEDLEKAGGR